MQHRGRSRCQAPDAHAASVRTPILRAPDDGAILSRRPLAVTHTSACRSECQPLGELRSGGITPASPGEVREPASRREWAGVLARPNLHGMRMRVTPRRANCSRMTACQQWYRSKLRWRSNALASVRPR